MSSDDIPPHHQSSPSSYTTPIVSCPLVVAVILLTWPRRTALYWWKNRRREPDPRCTAHVSISRSHILTLWGNRWMDEWRRIKESLRWNGSIGSEEVSHHIGCSGSYSSSSDDDSCGNWTGDHPRKWLCPGSQFILQWLVVVLVKTAASEHMFIVAQ